MSTRRVYLHVGAPKTGTTYVQDRLTLNARTLAKHGVHVPTGSPLVTPALFHFRAALDLLDQDWGGPPGHAEGAWDALVRKVRRTSGTVVVSHEILAPANRAQVARAKRDLGGPGTELHVVYSARDLARQVPAAWQESIKQGRKWTYRRFLARTREGRPWFSRAFDLPTVLGTWAADLPPEQVHLVTVPPRRVVRASSDELWLRFCRALGIDPAWAPRDSDRTNQSLGITETQVIRRLNRRMDRATRREAAYDELIREMLAQGELVDRTSAPVRLPPEMYPWAEEQAQRWIDWAEGSGIDVVGDLEELRPGPPPTEPWQDPDRVPPKQQLVVALDALGAMTREAARRNDPEQAPLRKARAQLDRLRRQ
ncbi:hypothetical protein GGQ22_14070 [Nocardioides sp. zg-579]|uniref:Sulfotransferase family protein n=1 Tax=Nocardioides marmotae TaxID=2663857 RepID=A0A6I3JDT8_9ACTN|nr:hypothetical protein [Nocardioides marmotae]MCR6032554.1 hypothetical protein [Gordonia jinghuaiqii]MTB96203.1 hypothetical protein [Nocardioides marmotae]QKD99724.1 hypothetical protein HPC71_00400 [Nocardioides marmotae]